MKKLIFLTAIILSVFLLVPPPLWAGGLSSTLIEVKLDKLEPGKSYSVKEIRKIPLIVTNTTEGQTLDIKIESERPVDYNLVVGYEPIPDLSWVKIEKDYFGEVGPKKSIDTDITITIPNDKAYYGKKYQVYIYSHTAGKAALRIGLMGRILLEIMPQ
jgi:hypothetical protein